MKHEFVNGIHTISSELERRIVNRHEYSRELAGEIIRVEVEEGCYEERSFTALRYAALILGKNDLVDNYIEIESPFMVE